MWTTTRLLLLPLLILLGSPISAQEKPRVFVFTDINIDSGDPDDRQSLIHLLWYADELEIEGIVPDRWEAQGYEACQLVLEAYEKDFAPYDLKSKGYPKTSKVEGKVATDIEHARALFGKAARKKQDPLYVLIWGNMETFGTLLAEIPEVSENIRVLTIGTGLMLESNIPYLPESWEKSGPCQQLNWNGFGRNAIYNNNAFDDMWWVELNWTYEGMFSGPEPAMMLQRLINYGHLGEHMKEVVRKEAWAQYFRVGDTPSVLYVIDKGHELDDPTSSSWAGTFYRPFPEQRPNYYTDVAGDVDWNYEDPCETWGNHQRVRDRAAATLEERRTEMYEELSLKLKATYDK